MSFKYEKIKMKELKSKIFHTNDHSNFDRFVAALNVIRFGWNFEGVLLGVAPTQKVETMAEIFKKNFGWTGLL